MRRWVGLCAVAVILCFGGWQIWKNSTSRAQVSPDDYAGCYADGRSMVTLRADLTMRAGTVEGRYYFMRGEAGVRPDAIVPQGVLARSVDGRVDFVASNAPGRWYLERGKALRIADGAGMRKLSKIACGVKS